ncbi:MAG: PEP-CTERM sorting domain-containing protein [Planctomycetota bacterium]
MKRFASLTALAAMAALAAGTASAFNAIGNGGFEVASDNDPAFEGPAEGWNNVAAGYGLSTDAFEGNFALSLASPPTNRASTEQNNVAFGGQPDLVGGSVGDFSFYAKGFAGTTGFAEYRIAFLNSVGGIEQDFGFVNFSNSINDTTWTLIEVPNLVVPVNANAILVQFGQSLGGVNGNDLLAGEVLVDNVVFTPEPSSLALLSIAGLATARRRRRA